jgi:hypothetical protein
MVTLQFHSIEELLKFKIMFGLAGFYDLGEVTFTTKLSEVEIETAKKGFGAKIINDVSKG